MFKSLILIAATIAAQTVHAADFMCSVSAEKEPGVYTKHLAHKIVPKATSGLSSTNLLVQGTRTYYFQQAPEQKAISVGIYDLSAKRLFSLAYSKSNNVMLIDGGLKVSVICVPYPTTEE